MIFKRSSNVQEFEINEKNSILVKLLPFFLKWPTKWFSLSKCKISKRQIKSFFKFFRCPAPVSCWASLTGMTMPQAWPSIKKPKVCLIFVKLFKGKVNFKISQVCTIDIYLRIVLCYLRQNLHHFLAASVGIKRSHPTILCPTASWSMFLSYSPHLLHRDHSAPLCVCVCSLFYSLSVIFASLSQIFEEEQKSLSDTMTSKFTPPSRSILSGSLCLNEDSQEETRRVLAWKCLLWLTFVFYGKGA